ncbi:C4-dicarboxylate transporter DctM subunit [Bacillus thermophilus]|uniref:C4-dicarboxylate transporter DctM subunit n=1 Tax=Siminovitchia thermophila TaxID=1245522 RepID=A0ABS2R3U6_9BACI|nr:TRAP transporter large permease [Siminovitchia thermophila]MBM7714287.1 C4-dicarboxylate transporter DctM subunit [Siminovitchia thermophila]ONK22190.1 C4-dicarboxylate ABC transporter permease [Bacillus sp. VT-16-64]
MVAMFFILTVVFFLLGVPMAITIGFSSIIYIIIADITPTIVIQRLFSGVDVSALMAIPFFILAGNLMLTGGLAQRILDLANSIVGKMTGGLALVTILGCMFFAAISGSSIATAAALGTLMIPAMVEKGYDRGFATAIVSTASPMGVIIPPSISLIIYGSLSGASISDLYVAGLPAGLIVGISLMIVVYIISKKRGYKGSNAPFTFSQFLKALKRSLWALGTPLILLGGVFLGIFTPTESGVIAVVYATIVGFFIYKELKMKDVWKIFLDSSKSTATIMFVIANAALFAYVLAYENIPNTIVSSFLSLSENPIVILLIINVILLFFGAFMDTMAILVIVVPMFLPIIHMLGIDPVIFGIIVVVNTAIGMATPPFGATLLISSNIGKSPLLTVSRHSGWMLLALIVALLVITYIPVLVMFPIWGF